VVTGAAATAVTGVGLGGATPVVGATLVVTLDAWFDAVVLLERSVTATMQNTPAAMPDQTLYAVLKPSPDSITP
jgi:hypothetical protein